MFCWPFVISAPVYEINLNMAHIKKKSCDLRFVINKAVAHYYSLVAFLDKLSSLPFLQAP